MNERYENCIVIEELCKVDFPSNEPQCNVGASVMAFPLALFCPSRSFPPSSKAVSVTGSQSPSCWVRGHKKPRIFQVPAVLELEAAMHQLLRQRASRLVQRRQDDIKDESAEFASLSSQSILKVFKIYLNGLVSCVCGAWRV